jgi:glycosyltransferase involved in cell wall biosynthesis
MRADLEVSVVMGVFNSADSLRATIDSVLSQESVVLESIVVDDGSTDGSGELLDEIASADPRLRVWHQPNRGLTAALARGCSEARAPFIARQDAGGDLSLPGRLSRQLAFMRDRPDAVMSTVGTRFVGPAGEHLYDVVRSDEELRAGLSTLSIPGVLGPSSHGSVMFRRDAYERVGGYRVDYVVAQDMDLWLRLFEVGPCLSIPEILCLVRSSPEGISSKFYGRQLAFGGAAIEAARCRRASRPEPAFPLQGEDWSVMGGRRDPHADANLHYFLGSCVQHEDRARARHYFWRALKSKPTHLRAAMKLLRSYLP